MPDIKEALSAEALRIVTGARRSAYGAPEQNFERIARLWNAHLVNTGVISLDTACIQARDVAAMMRLMKEARLAETPDHADSYVDLVGYALCGAEVAGVEMPGGKMVETHPGRTVTPEEKAHWQKLEAHLAGAPKAAEPAFKVGDRVRVVSVCSNAGYSIGQEGTVVSIEDGFDDPLVALEGMHGEPMYAYRFERIEPAPEAPKPPRIDE